MTFIFKKKYINFRWSQDQIWPDISRFKFPNTSRVKVLFSKGYLNKVPQLSALRRWKFNLLQFWRLEVQNQGLRRPLFFLKTVQGSHFLPLLASGSGRQPWAYSCYHASLCFCVTQYSPCVCLSFPLIRMSAGLRVHLTPIWHYLITNYKHLTSYIYNDLILK